MGVSLWPAVVEVLKLGGIGLALIALCYAYLWVNYKIWSLKAYLPLTALISVSVGFGMIALGAGGLSTLFAAVAPLGIALYFRYGLKGAHKTAISFVAPAALGVLLLFLYPLLYEFYLSFHDLNLSTFSEWIKTGSAPLAGPLGLSNYLEVFAERATGQSFVVVFLRTVLWTVVNVVFHVGIGLVLAMLLNTKGLRGRGFYRMVLTLPWVIPQVIAVLVWRADFNESAGFINRMIHVVNQLVSVQIGDTIIAPLTWFGFTPHAWFVNPSALFAAACLVNIWLGIPFMMINALGALQSIPGSVYEAASIDGANAWQKFRHVTLPLLKPVMVPASVLGAIWTFNNLNVIYLMTDGGRYEGADILVTDLFKQSFTYYRYGFAAAYSFVIFAILCVFTYFQLRVKPKTEGRT